MTFKPIEQEDRILRYHEDEHFSVIFRAYFDYDRSDMWTTVCTINLRTGESKRWIFSAKEIRAAQNCFTDQLRLLF